MNQYISVLLVIAVVIAAIAFVSNSNQVAAVQARTSQIIPGSSITFSCPLQTSQKASVTILSTSGLAAYNINGTTDYVLSPGSSGVITVGSGVQENILNNGSSQIITTRPNATISAPAQNLTFYHQIQSTANYTVTPTSSPVSGFKICYTLSNSGSMCRFSTSKPSAEYAVISTLSSTHPGISVSSKTLDAQSSGSSIQNGFVINAASNAPEGTYWVEIDGGPCLGGQLALVTIGSTPYSGPAVRAIYA